MVIFTLFLIITTVRFLLLELLCFTKIYINIMLYGHRFTSLDRSSLPQSRTHRHTHVHIYKWKTQIHEISMLCTYWWIFSCDHRGHCHHQLVVGGFYQLRVYIVTTTLPAFLNGCRSFTKEFHADLVVFLFWMCCNFSLELAMKLC